MNVFVFILLFLAMLGLFDKVLGNRLGLAAEFMNGLSKLGSMSIPTIGLYCVGMTIVNSYGGAAASGGGTSLIDPSLLAGCLLATDIGGLPLALGLANDPELGFFSGAIVASCLGQFIGFQLPALFAAMEEEEKPVFMRGFLKGVGAVPVGVLVGGLVLQIPFLSLILNTGVIAAICALLVIAFRIAPWHTEKVLMVLGAIIRAGGEIVFGIVIVNIFIPSLTLVDEGLIAEALVIVIKMGIVVCGGMVFAGICKRAFSKQLPAIGRRFGTNGSSVIGLVLNSINSLAMAPLISQMDENGRKLNAAFAVSGAYIFGGQMAFIASVGDTQTLYAYMAAKLTAGALSVIIASREIRKEEKVRR